MTDKPNVMWQGRTGDSLMAGEQGKQLLELTVSSEQDWRTDCNIKVKLWPVLERGRAQGDGRKSNYLVFRKEIKFLQYLTSKCRIC